MSPLLTRTIKKDNLAQHISNLTLIHQKIMRFFKIPSFNQPPKVKSALPSSKHYSRYGASPYFAHTHYSWLTIISDNQPFFFIQVEVELVISREKQRALKVPEFIINTLLDRKDCTLQ